MQVALLQHPGLFAVVDRPIREIAQDEVLVRAAACGVCTSDLHLWTGDAPAGGFPRRLGHEVSTIIRGMRTGMRLPTSGWLCLDGLATHRFPVADIGQDFATAGKKQLGFAKATVLVADGGTA